MDSFASYNLEMTVFDGDRTRLETGQHQHFRRLLPFYVLVNQLGTKTYVQYGERDFTVQSGESYLLPANVAHSLHWMPEGAGAIPFSIWCHFNVSFCTGMDFLSFFSIPSTFSRELSAKLREKCLELIPFSAVASQPDFAAIAHRNRAKLELLDLIVSGCHERREAAEQFLAGRKVAPVLDFMMRHLDGETGIAEAAAVLHLSPSRFSAVFHAATGVPPGEYWRNLRLSAACKWFYAGGTSIKEAAEKFGFYDEFHFSKCFKQKYLQTPAALLRRLAVGHRW